LTSTPALDPQLKKDVSYFFLDLGSQICYLMGIMREIRFYHTSSGADPVRAFLSTLTSKQARKVAWVLRLVRTLDRVPRKYFEKLVGTQDLWEVRVQYAGDIFRLLGFFDEGTLLILCSGFGKKTRKIPPREIELAEARRRDYFKRKAPGFD